MGPRSASDRARGFSLVELMVTIAVLGVVMIAMFTAFIRSNDATRYVARVTEVRQTARAAVQLLERDLRMAGSGWGRMEIRVANNGVAELWPAIQPGPGAGACDSLRLLGAWDASTTLAQNMLFASSPLMVNNASGFATGDLVVVTDGIRAHMLEVTAVNTGTGELSHDGSSTWNNTALLQPDWPPAGGGGYPGGSTFAYKVTLLSYRVDSTGFRRPCLVRSEYGRPSAVVMYDVDRFQVWYRIMGSPDSVTRAPTGGGFNVLNVVDRIQPRIHTRAATARHAIVRDSVWAEILPRTF